MAENKATQEPVIFPQPDVIDLYALFKLLWSKKFIIAGVSFIVACLTAVITLQMPNIYKSTTTLLPVSAESSGGLSQYAGLAAMAGISLPGGGGTDVEKIMAILQSRTLKERVIEDLDLIDDLLDEMPKKVSPLYAAIEEFGENLSVSQDKKTSLITIGMESEDPELAARVVNYIAEVLTTILDEKNLTISSKKLALTERQLNEKRENLEVLKNRLLDFQRRTQVIVPESQANGVMQLYSTLVQQKIGLEVELETLKSALSERNPKITVKEQQLEAVQYQLDNISSITSDGKFDTKDMPENLAEFTEISAEMELAQKMYLAVFAQWEQLKMQEQEDKLYVEVIDRGVVSEVKFGPRRSFIVLLFFSIAFLSISFFVWFRKEY